MIDPSWLITQWKCLSLLKVEYVLEIGSDVAKRGAGRHRTRFHPIIEKYVFSQEVFNMKLFFFGATF